MTGTPLPHAGGTPGLAVVIPVHGHPVLLAEAVESVLAQLCEPAVGVVIVSDGCPNRETDLVASAYATAHPNSVFLRKANGGPSSARNLGIAYVLRHWPAAEAVFFLDADNRLAPTALDDALAALRAHPGTGWVYPHITGFGTEFVANYDLPYSPLLHVAYDNICDTGCLVSRAVLEAGVRFDEDARSGYEDWDFWLQCLERGFRGRHAPFGFAYRQRPESRFREMNRSRVAQLEHLRRRHPALAAPRTLIRWEHEDTPRFLHRDPDGSGCRLFTDPDHPGPPLPDEDVACRFHAALRAPDEVHVPPFLVWGEASVLAALRDRRLLHGLFALLAREAGRAELVALTWQAAEGEIAVAIGPPAEPDSLPRRAVLWAARIAPVRDWVAAEDDQLPRLDAEASVTEIALCAPGRPNGDAAAWPALRDGLAALRLSPFRTARPVRPNWRPQHFPDRSEYYRVACDYLGVSCLPPHLAGDGLQVALVLPIASYGGAEKVAYALARFLRDRGAGVHLLLVGPARMTLIGEYEGVFDTITFLAEPDMPLWGGALTVFGQECHPPDAPAVHGDGIAGLLCDMDLVVNCHSAPMNAVMGRLRGRGVRTATYLHVFDATPLHRPVGHPYLTIGFEHAYDLVLTCSRQLADDLHALGIPADKITAIPNAASFRVPEPRRAAMRAWRATPRGARPLRALSIGRLDRQKGVERLIGTVALARARNLPVEFRIIGSALIEADGTGWADRFRALGIPLQSPIHASDALAEAYAWADVLLLPSRWEGAPLVIPECGQLGCIPIATDVGAMAELICHGADGLLIDSGEDARTAEAMTDAMAGLIADDGARRRLAAAALDRAGDNDWNRNFQPVAAWLAAKGLLR